MASDPRPPTILSEFGEGYCRWCHFVEGLGADGTLYRHSRGIADRYGSVPDVCDGSGKPPAKLTPVTSRLAAFSTRARTGTCPACGQTITIDASGRWAMHGKAPGAVWCRMSQKVWVKGGAAPPLRPHERG
jgi:hypothetical protein